MGMTPAEFFESFVEGNAEEYRNNPECIRRAFNAAVSASHLADNYFEFNRRYEPGFREAFKKTRDYVDYLAKQTNGTFRDIRSIANAYKHLYTDSSVHSTVNSSGAIELTNDKELESIEEDSDKAVGRSSVVFTRKNGTKSEFLPVLNATIDYWRNVIYPRA